MGKYFGTDGIRGAAGSELTPLLAYNSGLALAKTLEDGGIRSPRVYVGKDTRISGDMLESSLCAGLMAGGAEVSSLGVVPTPAVAYLVKTDCADAGIVISASHNPFYDNGIKIFGGSGFKLSDEQEQLLESYIDNPPAVKTGGEIGTQRPYHGDPAEAYAAFVRTCAEGQSLNFRLLIDCANGAASRTAGLIFPALGADCDFLARNPDGININESCGSTHMDILRQKVAQGGYHLGIAFDGDADRCLMVDEKGDEIDGDQIMGALAVHMKAAGTLKGDVVGTVMSNLGLHSFLKGHGIGIATTGVGDRYVLEEMLRGGHNLGGEQSGHVILSDYATTGDGELTAAIFLAALKADGRAASRFAGQVEKFPQVLINVPVPGSIKAKVAELEVVLDAKAAAEEAFGGEGRILIRPSGTEPKVRVMAEGRDPELVQKMAELAVRAVKDATAGME